HLPLLKSDINGTEYEISLEGFMGGHSGVSIDKGRANPNHLMGRLLYALKEDIRLLSVNGGLKDNAIPRSSKAVLVIPGNETDTGLEKKIEMLFSKIKDEYRTTDPSIECRVKECGRYSGAAFDKRSTEDCIRLLYTLPNGIIRMSPHINGLPQTSLNLGVLKTEENEVIYGFALRSSVSSEKEELVNRLLCITESAGGHITLSGDYPAWEYREDSPLRDTMLEVYKEMTGEEAVVTVIHAGLECGIFSAGIKDLECISIGPEMKNIHTPKESLDTASAERTWRFLLKVLERLK
nr:M20/M25/M40 family metallo-hydrolase [Lachnospiraceae bacterium]